MEPQKPGYSPRPGPESHQKVSGVEFVVGQCRMRSEASSGAAERILDSANPREITVGCVRCSEDEKEHSEGAQVPPWKLKEPV